MTSQPIETAYVEILPDISRQFGADVVKAVNDALKPVEKSVAKSMEGVADEIEDGLTDSFKEASKDIDRIADDIGDTIGDEIERGTKDADKSVDRFSKNAKKRSDGVGSAFKKAAGIAAGAFAAVAVGDLFKDAIASASEFQDVVAANDVVFGAANDEVNEWAANATAQFGLSGQQAVAAAGNYATFGKSAGLVGDDLAGFSTELAGLAADLASFKGTSTEQAVNAVGAALRGEAEPIRAYGVLLDDASLRQEALAKGLVETTKNALTPQQKVLAAQSLILKQTGDAQGDYARTSDSAANTLKTFQANVDNVRVALGTALLPVVSKIFSAMNDAIPVVTEFAGSIGDTLGGGIETIIAVAGPALLEFFQTVGPIVKDAVGVIGDTLGSLVGNLSGIFEDLRPAFETIVDAAKDLGPALVPALSAAADVVMTLGDALEETVGWLVENKDIAALLAGVLLAVVGPALAVAAATAAMVKVMQIWTAVTRTFAAVQAVLNAVLLANPLGIIILAIGALVAAVVIAYRESETFRNIVHAVGDALMTGLGAALDFVKAAFDIVVGAIKATMGFLQNLLNPINAVIFAFSVWSKIGDIVAGVFSAVIGFLGKALKNIGKLILKGLLAVLKIHAEVWKSIWDLVTSAISRVVGFWATLPGRTLGAVRSLLGMLRSFFGNVMNSAKERVQDGINSIITAFRNLPGKLRGLVGSFTSAGAAIIGGLLSGLKSVGSGALDIGSGIANAVIGLLNRAIGSLNRNLEFSVKILGKSVSFNPPDIPGIPFFAKGGIVDKATMGIFGEAGAEALIPLSPRFAAEAARLLDQSGLLERTDIARNLSAPTLGRINVGGPPTSPSPDLGGPGGPRFPPGAPRAGDTYNQTFNLPPVDPHTLAHLIGNRGAGGSER